jgi:hypothetical protein
MNAILLALPLLSAMQAANKVVVTVDAKSGEVITGERKFTVHVQSNDPVSQVEFYVGSDLRDSDTSTPYEFRIDSLAETDGPLKVMFKAYTSSGSTGTATLNLKIDNLLSKGLAYHVDQGRGFLAESNWQSALTEGRLALKVFPNSNAARLVLARANLGLGVLDNAQKYAEDAVANDPKDRQALDLLAVIDLKRAYTTVSREGDDQSDTRKSIADALKAGVEARRKSADILLDSIGNPTDANIIAYADAAIAAKIYYL